MNVALIALVGLACLTIGYFVGVLMMQLKFIKVIFPPLLEFAESFMESRGLTIADLDEDQLVTYMRLKNMASKVKK